MELLIIGGLIGLFFAFAYSSNDTSKKPTGVVNGKSVSAKNSPTHTSKSPKLSTRQKREHRIKNALQKESLRSSTQEASLKVNPYTIKVYWFENGEPLFPSKPWFREFLIELDEKYRGNLEKKCKDGGEKLSDVIAFVESDPVLLKSVKVIVMKYSERKYEKYFGSIKSRRVERVKKVADQVSKSGAVGPNKIKNIGGRIQTDFAPENEIFKNLAPELCFQTLNNSLEQSIENSGAELSKYFERKPVSEAMICITALYVSTCNMALKTFCVEYGLRETYDSSIDQILSRKYTKKAIQSINYYLDRNERSNIMEIGNDPTEVQIHSHVQPYAELVFVMLNINRKDVKEALTNALITEMTQIINNMFSFVLFVRSSTKSGISH